MKTVEVLSSENDSTLEFSALTDLCAKIGVRLSNAIFANHERIRLDMKKQEEEISKKYDFLDDDDDKKDFPDDISIKMKITFPMMIMMVLMFWQKKKVIMKWIIGKRSPTHLRKGKMILTIGKQFFTLLQEGRVEMKLTKKYVKNPKLETLAETEKQAIINDQKFLKNELEQNKVDLKLSREAELKKVQDVFDEVMQEESLDDIETFFYT